MRTINGNRSSSARSGKSTTPTPCCSKTGIKRGPWTPEEDEVLANYVRREGEGRWRTLPNRAGLLRCGKSCRLRWVNYLRPSVKRGPIAPDEEDLILRLHRLLGNRWSLIAGRIPGRTDNEIKNYWNTHLSKKLISQGIDPRTHKPLEIINPSTSIDPVPKQITSSLEQENHEKCVGDSYQKTGNQIFNEQGDNNNGYDLDICLTEDTFSSFLDSLIDENSLFLTQNQQATNPVAVEDQCPSIWEAQVLQSMANFGPGYEQRPCNGQAN